MDEKTKKRILTLLGIVILSILAMVLYDIFIKPMGFLLRDFFLNLTSLWIQSIKDSTYQMIAKGFHEQASCLSYSLVNFIVAYFALAVLVLLLLLAQYQRKRISNHLDETLETSDKESETSDKFDELLESPESFLQGWSRLVKLYKWLVPALYVVIIFGVVTLVVSEIRSRRLKYINSAITHYQQVLCISEPFLNDIEKKQSISSFAQIQNKEDYISAVGKLEKIARENNQHVPKFEAW
jgi:hypothetical protein